MKKIVRMTLKQVRSLPPLTDERIKEIMDFDEKFDDPECPPLSKSELKEMRPCHQNAAVAQTA